MSRTLSGCLSSLLSTARKDIEMMMLWFYGFFIILNVGLAVWAGVTARDNPSNYFFMIINWIAVVAGMWGFAKHWDRYQMEKSSLDSLR